MRSRAVGAAVVAVTLTFGLTGCTPGQQGQTGLMIDATGIVYGVVHVCRGTVSGFSMWDEENSGQFGNWSFDEVVSDTGKVELANFEDFQYLIGETKTIYFSAGTDGEAGGTTPLRRADIDLDALIAGEVLYVTWDDKGDYKTATADSYEAFGSISCEGY
jgi:hypothetical protein